MFFCVLVLACALTGGTPLVVGGAVVGTAAKVPVKATGAAIDAATDGEEDSDRADEDAD